MCLLRLVNDITNVGVLGGGGERGQECASY